MAIKDRSLSQKILQGSLAAILALQLLWRLLLFGKQPLLIRWLLPAFSDTSGPAGRGTVYSWTTAT